MAEHFDLLVIGGGINGAGIARDAAGRGLTVLLCEKADLGWATSSASSKLIHGGLRYLEHYAFRLVRESLTEREVLWRIAPHLIHPLRFVLPYHRGLRPAWLLRCGLFVYDHLGGRKALPPTRTVRVRADPAGRSTLGFEYSDCWVDDSRLVALNALGARELGAEIRTRTLCRQARRVETFWEADLENEDGAVETVRAALLVNATGPWVKGTKRTLRLVKGSHIVVPRLHDDPRAFTLQNADGRIVFVLPYEQKFSLIGTTDVPYQGDPADARISEEEVDYLRGTVRHYFSRRIQAGDIVWSYSGVRPLYDDGSASPSDVTREYLLEFDAPVGLAPALTIYGGKITTYRRLAEEALGRIQPVLKKGSKPWTSISPLPGGDLPGGDFDSFLEDTARRYGFLPHPLAARLCRAYGTYVERFLGGRRCLADLGEDFGAGLHEAELDYLRRTEWASRPDDALWRRSKIGLHLTSRERERVAAWYGDVAGAAAAVGAHDPLR